MSQQNAPLFPAQKPLELILARNLLTNISAPGVLADHRGALVFYNEAAGVLLGIPFKYAGKMDPEEWGARFGPFDRAGGRIPVEEVPLIIALREGRPVHAPLYIHSVDREVHHIEVSAIPLTTNEEISGVVGIFWRIEERSSSATAEP
jgi:PAS domain-containing protein